MPAKKKIKNESKTTEIRVKNDMKRCKQTEEKLNECIDISDEDETMNQMNQMKQVKRMKQNNQYQQSQIQRINTIILFLVQTHMC